MTEIRDIKKHPRYRSLACADGRLSLMGINDPLQIVFYIKNSQLRYHTIKHFGNEIERDRFRKVSSYDAQKVCTLIDSIKNLGCSFLHDAKTENPLCQKASCPLFQSCTKFAKPLEEIYLTICEKSLFRAVKTPRLASYYSKKAKVLCYHALSDQAIESIFSPVGEFYNLRTCNVPYAARDAKQSEIISTVVSRITMQAASKLNFYSLETWGLSFEEDDFLKKGKKSSSKKGRMETKNKKKSTRYIRQQKRSRRDYQAEFDDDKYSKI